ncbi:hypothetical protein [Mesorhizobium sp. STM 4661]|nr:hypothetical protein [Mesorhizobium sp. STM 4661]
MIKAKVDTKQIGVGTVEFWEKVNNFDRAAIEAQAKECKDL